MRHRITEALQFLIARLQQLRLTRQLLVQCHDASFRGLLLSDVERDSEQQRRLTIRAANRHFQRMQHPPAMIAGVDLLLRNLDDVSAGKRFAIRCREMVGLLRREELMVVAPEQLLAVVTDDLLGDTIDSNEA